MAAGLEQWRELFRGAGADIFDVIEHAILVAASDSPQEFRHHRDRIAEKLYTALAAPRCFGCAAAAGSSRGHGAGEVEEGNGSVRREAEKESKVDSSSGATEEEDDDDESDDERLRRAAASNYGYSYDDDDDEADALQALTEEIEEESQVVGEVLRIKELLMSKEDQSDSVLFESLRRLQLMQLSVETLKATEIGRAVNGLRKHNSQEIHNLVRTLIESWKVLVDAWVSATAAIADKSPDSMNPSVVDDEEGLPSPPLDEGAFFATQTTSIQLAEFFDGMDDDGNLRNNNGDFENKREKNGGRPLNHEPVRKQQPPKPVFNADDEVQVRRQELSMRQEPSMRQTKPQRSSSQLKPYGTLSKQSEPLIAESGPGRPPKAASQQKPYGEMKPKQIRDLVAVQRKPAVGHVDKSKFSLEASVGAKLELAKRKLQERYQEAENAKKQRTIQVMELTDIPKPAHQNRRPSMKSRNHIRSWANGRH